MGFWNSGLRNVPLTVTEFSRETGRSSRKAVVKKQKPQCSAEASRLQLLVVRARREEREEGRGEGRRKQ